QELGGMYFDATADQVFTAPQDDGQLQPYRVDPIVDRIGTGDAFTAGLLHALTTPELSEPQRAIAFAAAAFCLSHSIEGDFNYSSRAEIEALMQGDRSGRVQR